MPEPLTSYIVDLWGGYNSLNTSANDWRQLFINLGNQIASQAWPAAQQACFDLGNDFFTQVVTPLCHSSGIKGDIYACLHWIDDNIGGGGGGCTMDDILTEMLSADFGQLQKFIGITDAYRMAIWNAPFNADFYAALARGFEQWPQG